MVAQIQATPCFPFTISQVYKMKFKCTTIHGVMFLCRAQTLPLFEHLFDMCPAGEETDAAATVFIRCHGLV